LGPSILSNDLAADLRDEWKEYLGEGHTPESISEKLILWADDEGIFNDEEEEYDYWLSFALIQWNTGRLQANVKEKALSLLNDQTFNKIESERWFEKSDLKKRRINLQKVKEKLEGIQPKAKKIAKPFYRKSILKTGDIITIKLSNSKYCILEIIRVENGKDVFPRGILYDYYSEKKPDFEDYVKANVLTLRIYYNLQEINYSFKDDKRTVAYYDDFQNQFTLYATSKRFNEPTDRIEFIKRMGKSKINENHNAIFLYWREFDDNVVKWLSGDIDIIEYDKEV